MIRAGIGFSIINIFAFWKLIPFYSYLLIISLYYTLYIFDKGDNFENHGYYNFYGFTLIVSIATPILLFVSFIIKMLYKKLFKRVLYIIIPILVIFFICYMKYLSLLRCDGYHTGLNGVKIDDDPDKYSCFYDYPKKCYIDIFSPFMDYSRFAGDCKTIRDPKQQKKYFTYFLLNEKFYENTQDLDFP